MQPDRNRIVLILGDITDSECDVIVNAANSHLLPGGGVCGAIHFAAGPELERACADAGSCGTGEVIMTDAFDLPCQRVIHAVGPIWRGGDDHEEECLASCYQNSVRLAAAEGFRTIAFPAISTGIYGYPIKDACRIALTALATVLAEVPEIDEVQLVFFSPEDLAVCERARSK